MTNNALVGRTSGTAIIVGVQFAERVQVLTETGMGGRSHFNIRSVVLDSLFVAVAVVVVAIRTIIERLVSVALLVVIRCGWHTVFKATGVVVVVVW